MNEWPTIAGFDLQLFAEGDGTGAGVESGETSTGTTEQNGTESTSESQESANQGDTEQSQETEGQEDTTKEKPVTSTIKVKFNHEEKEIPLEEATTLIQKGMNYDKVQGKHNDLETALRARDEEVARRFGAQGIRTWDDLIRGWDNTQRVQQTQVVDQQFQTAVRQMAAKYNANPDILLEVVQGLVGQHPAVIRSQQLEQENGQIKTQAQFQERVTREAAQFKTAYPDLDSGTIPQEVWDRVNRGYSLLDSYQIYENRVLKEQLNAKDQALKVQEQNKKNAANNPGSVSGNGNVPSGHFTRAQVEKMSQTEVTKNYDQILESMKTWK